MYKIHVHIEFEYRQTLKWENSITTLKIGGGGGHLPSKYYNFSAYI